MPTSRFWVLVVLAALPGCSGFVASKPETVSRIELDDGMIVSGANGWCVDPTTSQASGDPAVVVLGSCAAIGQNALAPQPDVPGVVTVSIERVAAGGFSPEALQEFFVTEAGRAVLARDGQAQSIEIIEAEAREDRLVLYTEDQSALPGTSSKTWRALFDLGGRFVSVSLYGLIGQPFEPGDGQAAVDAQVDALIAANTR